MLSKGGFVFGIINIIGNFGTPSLACLACGEGPSFCTTHAAVSRQQPCLAAVMHETRRVQEKVPRGHVLVQISLVILVVCDGCLCLCRYRVQ